MRGNKAAVMDEDYEVGADAEEGRPAGGEKPLSSRYRGVCWNRKNRRWQAAINSGGKYVYLGSFLSEYDAARAFDKAAVKLRGTRAKLNFQYSEYVDENGNLLEDPKMKNVMYKIEAIQGGGGGGHHHGIGGGTALKAEQTADDGDLPHGGGAAAGDGLQPQIPLPLPHVGPEDAATATLPPPLPPHRQLSPLIHGAGGVGGGAAKQQQPHVCSSDGSKGPEWQGPRLPPPQPLVAGQSQQQQQPIVGLNLAAPPGGLQQQQQQQRPQVDPSPFPPFSETVTTGGTGAPAGAGGPALPLPASALPGRMQHPVARGRGGPQGTQPPSPLHHMYGSGAPPCMSGGGIPYDVPPGVPAVLGPPGRAPPGGYGAPGAATGAPRPPVSAAAQRAIQLELQPHCSLLSYVANRFSNSTEDMVGVLYYDAGSPGLVGSAVWTGKHMIRMGLYDTERDARQASIRCMQLYCVFYQEESRAELFNAMTQILSRFGNGAGENEAPGHYARASGSGSMVLGELQLADHLPPLHPQPHHAAHPHSQGGPHGPRGSGGGAAVMSYNGPNGDVGLQRQQQQQQQQQSSGYGPEHDPHGAEPGCGGGAAAAVLQQQQQHPTAAKHELDNLFQYMAMISRSSRNYSNAAAPSANGGGGVAACDANSRPDADGGAGGVLGKRGGAAASQHDGYASLHELAQPARHGAGGGLGGGGAEFKRMRLDSCGGPGGGDGGSEVELVLKPPSSEFRAAHKMQLPVIVKQLQQASAGAL